MKLFISPHDDDHALFGAFTCLREHPVLVVVFDGHVQQQRGLPVTWQERAQETAIAADILECERVVRLGFSDANPSVTVMDVLYKMAAVFPGAPLEHVYIPANELNGHEQHNLCAFLCGDPISKTVSNPSVTQYLTYTRDGGKSTSGKPVPIERGDWIASKLQALSCYKSQMNLDPRMGCFPHFLRDQTEYYL